MKMKKTVALIIAALFITPVFARYENADAVFEKITKTYTLNSDGSTDFHYHKQLNLKTYLAFNRLYGETFIVYNPEFQKLTIDDAYTVMADGRKVEAPDNAFNEVLPRAAAHSAAFNHLREMVVTHTALERGATIFLDYTIHSQKDFMPALMGNEVLEESSPIKEMVIEVKVPAGVELNYQVFNLRTAPEIVVLGSEKVYTWKFEGLPAQPKESFRGDEPDTPRLIFSTAANLEELTGWITRQQAFDLKLNDDMRNFAQNEKAENSDEINTMLAIHSEVAENMAYDRVPPEWTGFRVRTPIEVWESNGGSQAEKAVLLSALLRAADFNAVPVMSGPEKFFDKKIPDLMLFDNTLVMVETKSFGTIYLSPVHAYDQSLAYRLDGQILIPLRKDGNNSPISMGNSKNKIDVTGEFAFEIPAQLTGLLEVKLEGSANPFLELHQDPSSVKSKFTGRVVSEDEDAVKIINSNPAKTELTLEVGKSDSLKSIEGYYRWDLPEMTNGFESWHINYLSSEREDPFVLPNTLDESYTYTVEIPEGYIFVNKDQNINLKSAAGSVKITSKNKGNVIEITRELKLDREVIDPADYEDFKAMVDAWLVTNYRMVVFKKVG